DLDARRALSEDCTFILCFIHVFFFECSATHRDLHSFPTRRSSDLTTASCRRRRATTGRASGCRPTRSCRCTGRGSRRRGRRGRRSEEHTSELQSRENLVCRLLLEKKKPSH